MKNNIQKALLATSIATALLITGCSQEADNAPTADDTAQEVNPNTSETTQTSTETSNENLASEQTDSSPAQVIEQPITILALGDSLTEGLGVPEDEAYPAQLQQALRDAGYVNATVVNSGLSGETSTGLVNRLDWVSKTNPDITILTTGANDAMRGIDIATIDQNIRTAIKQLQDNGSIVVLGGMQIYDNMGDDYVKAFSDIYPKIAEDTGVAFIPFFLEGVGGNPELNQADAIHPTSEGYTRIVQNNILPILTPTLEEFVEHNEESEAAAS